MSPNNFLKFCLKNLFCVTVIILLCQIIMFLFLNKNATLTIIILKKIGEEIAPVMQNGVNKYNSLLFRKFDDNLLKGSND